MSNDEEQLAFNLDATDDLPGIPARDPSEYEPRVRARTLSIKRLSKRELARGAALYPERDYDRPRTRHDCTQGEFAARPCPFVSCKFHLFLDVSERTGAIKFNFPDLEPDEMGESCALDVADRDGETLEEIGSIMNLTRERIRQVETKGLARLKALADLAKLQDQEENDLNETECAALLLSQAGDEIARDVTRNIEPEKQSSGNVQHARPYGHARVHPTAPTPFELIRQRGDVHEFALVNRSEFDSDEQSEDDGPRVPTDPAALVDLCVSYSVTEKSTR